MALSIWASNHWYWSLGWELWESSKSTLTLGRGKKSEFNSNVPFIICYWCIYCSSSLSGIQFKKFEGRLHRCPWEIKIEKKYFINENDTIEKLPESCSEIGLNKSQIFTQNLTLSEINNDSGIIYPYIICGVTVTVTGVMFYILHCQNVLKKIGEQNASIEDKREDVPLNGTLVCFFAAVIINLFGIQVKCGSNLSRKSPRINRYLEHRYFVQLSNIYIRSLHWYINVKVKSTYICILVCVWCISYCWNFWFEIFDSKNIYSSSDDR